MARGFWTPVRLEVLRDRYAKDGPSKLAKDLQTTVWSVIAKARRMGLDSTRKRPPKDFEWTPELESIVRDRYATHGGQAIADELGLSLHTVRHKAQALGVHTKFGIIEHRKQKARTNTRCNIRYFNVWSPSMAYVLGFLFADGSVTKSSKQLRILLAQRDADVLRFIRSELEAEAKIRHAPGRFDPRTGNTNQPSSCLIIDSTVVVARLSELGMKPRKTFTDEPFPEVPDGMLPHFTRGFLDGDGSVAVSRTMCQVAFCGSVRFMAEFHDKLVTNLNLRRKKVSVRGTKTKYAEVYWSAREDLIKLRDFLYPADHGFCLQRKKQKLIDWLS